MPIVMNDWDKQRSGRRYRVNFNLRWGRGVSEEHEGTLADLSSGGCFVESGEAMQADELVKLRVRVPDRGDLTIWGRVVFRAAGRGFGVQFTAFAQDGSRDRLEQILLEAAGRA